MLNALIVNCAPHLARERMTAAREALEDRGWETLVIRRSPDQLDGAWATLAARWMDCDLAVLVGVPPLLQQRLHRLGHRPVIRLAQDAEGQELARDEDGEEVCRDRVMG